MPSRLTLDAEAHQEVEKLEVNLKNARDDLDRTWMLDVFQTPMPPFFFVPYIILYIIISSPKNWVFGFCSGFSRVSRCFKYTPQRCMVP